MQFIKCTKKLQTAMGLKPSQLSDMACSNGKLGSWHANLIYIDGKKCVVFANDKTLFNFIATDVIKAQFKNLSSLFTDLLQSTLASEQIPQSIIALIIAEYDGIDYKKTDSRSVLGTINDLAFIYKNQIRSSGGVHSYKIPEIISQQNHMPMGALKYGQSIVALRELYGL